MPLRHAIGTAKTWFQDHIFRRLFKNASWLMAGNALAGVIGLATMAVTARVLDPSGFGLFALMTTYAALVDRLLNFQTSQALIKYGIEAIENKDQTRLRQLIKFCTLLDSSSALIATIVAMLGVALIKDFLALNSQQAHWLVMYCLVIFFNLSGVPTATLRMYNRFYMLSFYKVITAALNLAGVCVIWYMGLGIKEFLMVMAASQIVGQLMLLFSGWRVLMKENVRGIWRTPLKDITKTADNIWHFVFFTNIESSVKIIRELDIFIIKAILSNEAVGLYRIARKLAEVLNLVIDPFFYAVYPEFSKHVARNEPEAFKSLAWRSAMIVGLPMTVVWLGFVVLGHPFIHLVFGESYLPSYAVGLVCMLGTASWGFFQPLGPALYSLGAYKIVFGIHFAVATVYIGLVLGLTASVGLVGAAFAYMSLFLIWGALSAWALKREIKLKWKTP